MIRQTAILTALFLVSACTTADEPGEQDTVIADVASSHPAEGSWLGSSLEFDLNDNRLSRLKLTGLGCVGELTPAGSPVCESLLSGVSEMDVPIEATSLVVETPYGLTLEGTFSDEHRIEGTFDYEADNGCCTSAGAWEAVHESLADADPPLPCHSEVSGEEQIGLATTTADGSFLVLAPKDPITTVPGFQGAIMVMAGIVASGFSTGALTVEISLEVPQTKVYAEVIGDGSHFDEKSDGTLEWREIWLILKDQDGRLLSPALAYDIDLIDRREATLAVHLSNTCGWSSTTEFTGPISYETPF